MNESEKLRDMLEKAGARPFGTPRDGFAALSFKDLMVCVQDDDGNVSWGIRDYNGEYVVSGEGQANKAYRDIMVELGEDAPQ